MDRDCIFVERTGLGPVGDRHLARLNFSIIKVGLVSFDPYLLAAIRFVLCALPAIFCIPRPTVKWGFLVAYGVMFGVLQWGLVYAGIYFGLSAGLASLVLQLAVFFTMARVISR